MNRRFFKVKMVNYTELKKDAAKIDCYRFIKLHSLVEPDIEKMTGTEYHEKRKNERDNKKRIEETIKQYCKRVKRD